MTYWLTGRHLINSEVLGPFCSQLGYLRFGQILELVINIIHHQSADGEVPELDCFVVAAGDDDEVAEPEAGDAVGVRAEGDEPLRMPMLSLPGGLLVTPHLDRLVVGGRHDPPPVGLEAPNHACCVDGGGKEPNFTCEYVLRTLHIHIRGLKELVDIDR